MQQKTGQPADPKPLDVYAECDHGSWRDMWGESEQFNRAIHFGRVTSARVDSDKVELAIRFAIGSDNWVKGGPATYEIDLKRDAAGTLTGSFSGNFENPVGGHALKGSVSGQLLPPVSIAAGFEPVQPGEHPRLLMRKSQIPALRVKAKTPFGKAMLELLKRLDDPVALGLLYQLTGERSYAERAKPATLATMNDRNGGPFALGRFWGYRTSVVGAAYDLCYDAWEPDFRAQVEDYLDWILFKCLHRQHRVGTVNWQPGSNYTVVIHAGNGMAALALAGEKGPPPVEPLPPRLEPPRLSPPGDLGAEKGAPISPLVDGECLANWLYIGPFEQHVLQHEHPYYDYRQPVDCLASMGGVEKARPVAGQTVSFKSQSLQWEPLSVATNADVVQRDPERRGKLAIRCTKLDGNRENRHLFFYTVLENDKPGWYRFDGPFYEGKCFVAGERILNGEYLYLEKGRFPLLVPAAIADGEYSVFVEFVSATEEDAKRFYADSQRQETYQRAKRQFDERLALWKAAGQANIDWLEHADVLRHWNFLCLRRGMGEGGFQAEGEGYTLECHHVIHDYACCFQNVFGRDVTGDHDIGYFAPRYIATGIWTPREGRDSREQCVSQSFGGHGGGTISANYLGRSIALCPKQWRPAVLWHWLKELGETADAIHTEAGARAAFAGKEFHDGLSLGEAFINFPLDMQPHSPDGILPRVWEAKTRGFYSFRNDWSGAKSIVAQVYAKTGEPCGWNQAEAGCFQIFGLGHPWATKDNSAVGKTGSRWLDNVVMLPDDPIDAWANCRVGHFEGDPQTGGGAVTFDLDNLYRYVKQTGSGKTAQRELFDGGIRGLRAFAADYSKKSGAEGLFAVADKIAGGKKKIWMWQMPHAERNAEQCKLQIEKDGFTLAYNDASLKATFIAPRHVNVLRAQGRQSANRLSNIDDADVDAIHVTADDPTAGDFFVVLTLQSGSAPAVKVTGQSARVGEREVTFDGQHITIR